MTNAPYLIRDYKAGFRIAGAEFGINRSSRAELASEGGWRAGAVRTAAGFWDRWRGLRPSPAEFGLILRTNSVHSFRMKADLWICGLRGMTVVGVRKLKPNRIVWIRGSDAILELPIEWQPPALGAVLSWLDAGPAHSLRNTDRKLGGRFDSTGRHDRFG